MAINSTVQKHHANVKPGKGFDLFYKIAPGRFRLWEPTDDPGPIYRDDIVRAEAESEKETVEAEDDKAESASTQEFAFEKDLRNYLGRNLHSLEEGLRLYEDEDRSSPGLSFLSEAASSTYSPWIKTVDLW